MRMYKTLLVAFVILFLLVGAANASVSDGIADNSMANCNTYDSIESGEVQSSYNGAASLNAADAISSVDDSQDLGESNEDSDVLTNFNLNSQSSIDSNDGLQSLVGSDEGSEVLESNRSFNGNTFSQLQTEINNCNVNDTINLNSNIYQDGSSQISIKKSITIDGNGHIIDAQGQSGIFTIQSYVILKNIIFKNANNRAIRSSSGIIVSNCTFINNSGSSGSAIFLEVNDGKIENCSFINNTAGNFGGAIFLQGIVTGNTQIYVEYCNFEYNHATEKGGGIYSDGENYTVRNCSFSQNSAQEGGAIYNNYIAFISNSNFTNNSANDGGAIYNIHIATVSYCNFTSNSANRKGNIFSHLNLDLFESYFENNTAAIGGAVYSDNNCSVANCTFIANSASNSGGAIYIANSSKYINACEFYNNSADDGGAIYWIALSGSIQNSNFKRNIARNNGGALFLQELDTYAIEVSSFFNNSAINGGAVYFVNSSINFDLSSFANNTALNGAAIYCLNSSIFLDFCLFNYNHAYADAGAIFLNVSNASIVDSYFRFNIAEERGSGICAISEDLYSILNITGSSFLNNKAKADSLIVDEIQRALVVEFNGLNNYINAIYKGDLVDLNLANVDYWSGDIVNSDNEFFNTGKAGHKIVFEVYGSQNELLVNTTLTTNLFGEQYYYINNLAKGNYTYKAYRLEDDYYTYAEAVGNFSTNKSTSSIVLDIADYAEFPYNNCIIPFNVTNRTVVTFIVTNENGSYVYINKSVDHFSDYITIDLGAYSQYYKITVFNNNNSVYSGSQDSKFFKIIRSSSSISIDDINDLSYGQKFNITFNVENKTSINVTIYDENGNVSYSVITQNDSIALPVLPIGRYNITLTNRGSLNVIKSNYSTSFNIIKADNAISVSANNVSYGDYVLIVVSAQVDGVYLLDVNGSLMNLTVNDGIGRVLYSLPVGDYYANVSFDDVNCNNFISNGVFSVYKADNFVSVWFDNHFNGDNVTVFINATADGVYLLDVNGSLMNVTVVDGVGSVELSLYGGEYYANVTFDDENYNTYVNNTTWFKPIDLFVPPVLSDDGQGDIILNLPEGSSGNLTVFVNHDQFSSVPVYGGENVIQLYISDIGENIVTLIYEDDHGYEYELSSTVYVKKPVDLFDIEFSDDLSILEFTVHMPEDVTGVLYVNVGDVVYSADIVDGEVNFSLSGLPAGFYVVGIEYLGNDIYEGFSRGYFIDIVPEDIDYGPGTVIVNHTGAGDAADIQAAIDAANPGDSVVLGVYDYVDVVGVNITKSINIVGVEGTTVSSSGMGSPIFNVPAISAGGPDSVNITGVGFKLNNRDVVVKLVADNDTDLFSIVAPSVSVVGNSFDVANEDVVPESIVVVVLESERGVLSPTGLISIKENTIVAGVSPFEFVVTSIASGDDAFIGPQNFTFERKATQIIYKDMNTTAVSPLDSRTGEYFTWRLVGGDGKPIANAPMQIGFNGVIYDEKNGMVTDDEGYARLQINLGYKGDYTFAICFLGNDEYNASFVVAKIKVDVQTPSLTVPNKSYGANAKTKSLTATFKTKKGTAIAGKKVTFTVNGKTYSVKTNDKGIATVKVSLNKKGTYKFAVKFAGDSTYSPISKTAKLTIK